MSASKPLIVRIGEALWGQHWGTPMATILKVDDRTTRRYGTGDRRATPAIAREMLPTMRERRRQLDDLIAEIENGD